MLLTERTKRTAENGAERYPMVSNVKLTCSLEHFHDFPLLDKQLCWENIL
jgi:hypothetical protein